MQLRWLVCALFLACGLAACSQEPDYTPEERQCIAQRYSSYDSKDLSQCVDVCKACMRGNSVTCNTSCKLRGASERRRSQNWSSPVNVATAIARGEAALLAMSKRDLKGF